MKVRNIFIVFVLSGFWHGANWTFILWGALNAIYFLPLLLLNKNRQHLEVVAEGKNLPSFNEFLNMTTTFGLTLIAWIFFRATNVEHAVNYISEIFSDSLFSIPNFRGMTDALITIVFILFFLVIEWQGRDHQYAIARLGQGWTKTERWGFYYLLVIVVLLHTGKEQQFIYFQF
jgi:D-alanyl-lipoteichoic acid acyltransferase DltB (MBOAT superfamily)